MSQSSPVAARPTLRSALCARAAACALALVALALPALPHQVLPPAMALRSGSWGFVSVIDLGGCPATITARSSNPQKLKVYAIDMQTGALLPGNGTSATVADRVDQAFVVQASVSVLLPALEWIEVCWVGSDYPQGPCGENNCSPYAPHFVPVAIAPMPLTCGQSLWSGFALDPVNAATGELVRLEDADLDLGGPLPVRFQRYYASRLASEGNAASSLGPGWLCDYDWELTQETPEYVEVVTSTGRVLPFVRGPFDADWTLTVALDVPYQLEQVGAGFRLGEPTTGLVRRFDAQGRLDRVEDANGNALTLAYGADGLSQVSDGLGRDLTLGYAAGRLSVVSDGTRSVALGYDPSGRLASVTDVEGKVTGYSYDGTQPALALLTARTEPLGNAPITQTWDAQGRVATQSDSLGHSWAFAYGPGGTTTVTDPDGETTVFQHDAAGRLLSWTDQAGQSVDMTYGSTGRRTSITDRKGKQSKLSYHAASGLLASSTEVSGAKTTLSYQPRASGGLVFHELSSVTRADGRVETFTRDPQGNLLCWTDASGEEWSYAYDARGQMLSATDPQGGTRAFSYNPDGTLATVTDEEGGVLALGYDALRRVTSISQSTDGATRMLSWDLHDQLVGYTDESGLSLAVVYDDNRRLTSLTDGAGGTWSALYDTNDAPWKLVDPAGHETAVALDSQGRVSSLSDGAGVTLDLGWDARGRLSGLTDAIGLGWSTGSDAEGLPSSFTATGEAALDLSHDGLGRWTRLERGSSLALTLGYDQQGNVTELADGKGAQVGLQRDARRLVERIDLPLAGSRTLLTRDMRGYVTDLGTPGGGTWHFGRGPRGSIDSVTDAAGNTTQYQRDARGWLVGATYPGGLGSAVFGWNDDGLLGSRQYSDGLDIAYTHDLAGRLTSSSALQLDWNVAGHLVGSNGIAATRDGGGRLTGLDLAPGKSIQFGWGLGGELRSVQTWIGANWVFDYDAHGRRSLLQRPNGLETRYDWSASGGLARLQEVDTAPAGGGSEVPLLDLQLAYDAVGQLRQRIFALALGPVRPLLADESFAYDPAARQAGSSYDALGRVTHDGELDFSWDLGGRLRQAYKLGLSLDLQWDGLDRPSATSSGGVTRDLVWNYALDEPRVSILGQAGAPRWYYVHTPDGMPLGRVDAQTDELVLFHFDDGGSPAFLSDAAGDVVATSAFDAYGRTLVETGSQDDLIGWRGASGTLALRDVGLYLDAGRVYDPDTARYLQAPRTWALDPIGSNPYVLDGANPVAGPHGLDGRSTARVEEVASVALGVPAESLERPSAAPAVDGAGQAAGRAAAELAAGAGLSPHLRMLVALVSRWSARSSDASSLRRLPSDPAALLVLHQLLSTASWLRSPEQTYIDLVDHALLPSNYTQAVAKMRVMTLTSIFLFPRAALRRPAPLRGQAPLLAALMVLTKGAPALQRLQLMLDVAPRATPAGPEDLTLQRPDAVHTQIDSVPALLRLPVLVALLAAAPRAIRETRLDLLLSPAVLQDERY